MAPPDGISRRSSNFDSASGILAADVLPDSMMSRATTAFSTPSLRASGSMIRRFAWCGTNAASSLGSTPAFSHTCRASGGNAYVAQRNTDWPACLMYGRHPSIWITSFNSGAEPQTTGLMPAGSSSAQAVTIAAPAPSPNRTAVDRSLQSVTSDSFSAPTTITFRAAPARIAWSALASAYEKPEQAVLMSYAPGALTPSFEATRVATFGHRSTEEHVATTIRSMSAAVSPEFANALPAAAADMSATVSPSAMRRSAMPTRSRIHASFVSTIFASSALVSTRLG